MANSCYVTGKVAARDVESLQKFLDMLKNERFLSQEFDATEITQVHKNKYTAEFIGCVKWSIGSAINSDKYGEPLNKTTKGLLVEMWSQEPGCEFEEHVVYANGVCICDETTEYAEYYRDSFDSLEELNEECETNLKEEDFDEDGIASIGGFIHFGSFAKLNGLGDEYFDL